MKDCTQYLGMAKQKKSNEMIHCFVREEKNRRNLHAFCFCNSVEMVAQTKSADFHFYDTFKSII